MTSTHTARQFTATDSAVEVLTAAGETAEQAADRVARWVGNFLDDAARVMARRGCTVGEAFVATVNGWAAEHGERTAQVVATLAVEAVEAGAARS